MTRISHGGRLDEAVERFGGKREKWLDLSTGINPTAYQVADLPNHVWQELPDDLAIQTASDATRKAYGVNDDALICLAPGAQAIIQNLPFLFKPQAVAIVGFTYQEHGVCWKRGGHEVYVTDGLESAEATARIVIVVNPNNPDGRIFDPGDLTALARRLGAKGGLLVVDESFGDVTPNASICSEAGREGLLVMRSLGKFYGLAGVRFGAAIGAPLLIPRLEERLGPWAVSGPALHVAGVALQDKAWRKRMVKKLVAARESLEEILIARGFEVVGGTGLYVLAQHTNAEAVARHLSEQHILVRQFPSKPDWLRFGLPGSKPGFSRLDKALRGFYSEG